MSVHSMTGFGRGEASDEQFTLTVEIKSVNHRYRDFRWRMSSLFNAIELDLKSLLVERFKRGSFDISINYKQSEKTSKFDDIDQDKVDLFLKQMKEVATKSDLDLSFGPTDFLRNEFYKEQDGKKEKIMQSLAKEAFTKALDSLEESRVSEGQKALKILNQHKKQYIDHFQKIEGLTEAFQENVEQRLRKRFSEFSDELQIEESRFLQEVVFYLEKMDVHEEVNRIEGHLNKLDELLNSKGEIGRQVDFMVQELNRETNTVGSKSSLSEISQAVVQMKVQLEKIREQGLNLQ